jgi:putative peptide zinc metalloprotease protein
VGRNDLAVHEISYGGETYRVLKDPLRNELFRLRPEQYMVHQLLDGYRSLEDIRACLTKEFHELSLSLAQLQELVVDLFRKGLLRSTSPGQAEQIVRRATEKRRRDALAACQNLLFIRLPGWDPQRFLDRCYPLIRGVFRPAVLLAGALLVAATWCFAMVHFEELQRRAPSFETLVAGRSLLLMWCVTAVVKVLHELGHAFTCRHYGGECHEIGVAFLIFSPSMYCDVSDASRLRSRRKRMAVSAAGIYVELVLSALAFILWWNSRAGVIHDVSWAVIVVASIGTLAFNLNPLLRLDGYYLLSDWLDIPNLRQKAEQLTRRFFAQFFFGLPVADDPMLPRSNRWAFVGYAVASALYRWQLVVVISLILYKALEPFGLQAVGLTLGLAGAVSAVWRGVRTAVHFWQEHRRRPRPSRRPYVALGLGVVAAIAFFAVPIPVIKSVPFIVEPAGAQHLFVSTPGCLVGGHVQAGQFVSAGAPLLKLSNRSIVEQHRVLQTAYQSQVVEVTANEAIGDAAQVAVAAGIRDSLRAELADCEQRLESLAISAPCDGIVIAGPPIDAKGPAADGGAVLAPATALDPGAAGAHLASGTHVLTIAPADAFNAVLLVDQFSWSEFTPGRAVRMKLEHASEEVVHGSIASRSLPSDEFLKARDVYSQEKAVLMQHERSSAPLSVAQVVVPLHGVEAPLLPGLAGEARLVTYAPSLGSWLWRQARLTFNFSW